jgi:DNA sulfur modification protein DndE
MFTIRLGQRASELCVAVKRQTGLRHWNEVCRWALCRSLIDSRPPKPQQASPGIAIDWLTLAGPRHRLLVALLRSQQIEESDAAQLAAHIERGLSELAQHQHLLALARFLLKRT